MLFTSLEFFVFLPLALVAFAALPAAQRWIVAAARQLALLRGLSDRPTSLYLGAVTLVVWCCAPGAGAHVARAFAARCSLAAGLVAVLGSLFAFKFYDFLAGELERTQALRGPSRAAAARPRRRRSAIPSMPSRRRAYLIDAFCAAPAREAGTRACRALPGLVSRRSWPARSSAATGLAAAVCRPACAPIPSGWCWACS